MSFASRTLHEDGRREENKRLNTARRPWFHGLSPVTAEVSCGGEGHRITWRRGKLALEDHDLLAERSLRALGAAPPVCLEILDAWRTIRGTEQLCDLLVRDTTMSAEELSWRREMHQQQLDEIRNTPPVPPTLKGHPQYQHFLEEGEHRAAKRLELQNRVWTLTLLEALPVALRQRLALSLLVNVTRHWHLDACRFAQKGHVEAALSELALPRLEQSAREWRRNLRSHRSADAELWLRAPEEKPACTLWADGAGAHGALSLPLAWFTDVWARGIALVDGCFVLEVMRAPRRAHRLQVLALKWERHNRQLSRGVPAPAIVVQRGRNDWRLAWW